VPSSPAPAPPSPELLALGGRSFGGRCGRGARCTRCVRLALASRQALGPPAPAAVQARRPALIPPLRLAGLAVPRALTSVGRLVRLPSADRLIRLASAAASTAPAPSPPRRLGAFFGRLRPGARQWGSHGDGDDPGQAPRPAPPRGLLSRGSSILLPEAVDELVEPFLHRPLHLRLQRSRRLRPGSRSIQRDLGRLAIGRRLDSSSASVRRRRSAERLLLRHQRPS
jgi:hypothetical protein